MKTTILLVDDHPLIRDALRNYLNSSDKCVVEDEANNGEEALKKLASKSYDLIITDINMPIMNGIEFIESLEDKDQAILVISMIGEASQIKRMLSLGANGYVLKNSSGDEIIDAIEAIMNGQSYYSKEVIELVFDNISGKKVKPRLTVETPLTRREKEILQLIVKEYTNQEIAEELFISVRTVEAHKRNLLEKTGSKTVAGLVIYAMERNLIDY